MREQDNRSRVIAKGRYLKQSLLAFTSVTKQGTTGTAEIPHYLTIKIHILVRLVTVFSTFKKRY
jgi:hypothetical protein